MFSDLLINVKRAPNKLKRETLRIPFVKELSEKSYRQTLQRYAASLPKLSARNASFVAELEREGVLTTDTETLSVPATASMLDDVARVVESARSYSDRNGNLVDIPQEKLMSHPDIFLWGLNETLLDIVENYVGMPVLYHGPLLRRNIANGNTEGLRKWHVDPEDYRMLKIFIYLNDVTIEGGPFEHLSKEVSTKAVRDLNYISGFISDEYVEHSIAPKSDWVACTGKKNTVVMADTCSLFHRAKPPVTADRFSLTFAYTSIQPKGLVGTWKYTRDWWEFINGKLNQRQRSCLCKKVFL
jgi:hypothetical protein